MPFDELSVSLHAAPSEEGGFGFDVAFSRVEENGTVTRLGIGHLEASWRRPAHGEQALPRWLSEVLPGDGPGPALNRTGIQA